VARIQIQSRTPNNRVRVAILSTPYGPHRSAACHPQETAYAERSTELSEARGIVVVTLGIHQLDAKPAEVDGSDCLYRERSLNL
jgi:hypothetical protein